MNNREVYDLAKKYIENLVFDPEHRNNESSYYMAEGVNELRNAIIGLSKVPVLSADIEKIKKSFLFKNTKDSLSFGYIDHAEIKYFLTDLRIGLNFFIKQFESNYTFDTDSSLAIRLPDIQSFGDLAKVSGDFKKAIEIPLLDSRLGSIPIIETAQPGSIWLMVSVGTAAAVNLIGGIALAAVVLKRKNAEAGLYTEHAKTLCLKNDQLKIFIDAQKTQLTNMMDGEAKAIASKHYSHSDPETIERLKLSITTVSNLIEKGAKILPTATSNDVTKMFPDYDRLALIESAIKKIA